MMNPNNTPDTGTGIHFEGMHIQVVISGKQTGGSFSVVEYQLAPATLGAPIHVHTHEDVYLYVLEGELVVLLDGKQSTIRSGQWIKILKGVSQALWSLHDCAVRYFEVTNPAGAENIYQKMADMVASGKPFEYEAMREMDQQFGLETDFQSIFEITDQYNLRLDQRYQSICW
jgi:uncharacterized cupin superfamily protein